MLASLIYWFDSNVPAIWFCQCFSIGSISFFTKVDAKQIHQIIEISTHFHGLPTLLQKFPPICTVRYRGIQLAKVGPGDVPNMHSTVQNLWWMFFVSDSAARPNQRSASEKKQSLDACMMLVSLWWRRTFRTLGLLPTVAQILDSDPRYVYAFAHVIEPVCRITCF